MDGFFFFNSHIGWPSPLVHSTHILIYLSISHRNRQNILVEGYDYPRFIRNITIKTYFLFHSKEFVSFFLVFFLLPYGKCKMVLALVICLFIFSFLFGDFDCVDGVGAGSGCSFAGSFFFAVLNTEMVRRTYLCCVRFSVFHFEINGTSHTPHIHTHTMLQIHTILYCL